MCCFRDLGILTEISYPSSEFRVGALWSVVLSITALVFHRYDLLLP